MSDETDNTDGEQKPWLFKPGQSGNPDGRPKGARSKLQECALRDLLTTWEEGGIQAVRAVQKDDPATYVRVVAGLLPKEVKVERPLDDLSDEELVFAVDALKRFLAGETVQNETLQ